jgi:hypothetical protein
VKFKNGSGKAAYYVLSQGGFDAQVPDKPVEKGLELSRAYLSSAGSDVSRVKLGDKVQVQLRFRPKAGKEMPNVAVVDLLPGGFELLLDSVPEPAQTAPAYEGEPDEGEGTGGEYEGDEGASLFFFLPKAYADSESSVSSFRPEWVDKREDRVVFLGAWPAQASEFSYAIRATSRGKFRVPPPFAQSMYRQDVWVRGVGDFIVVE